MDNYNLWEKYSDKQLNELEKLAQRYKNFLNHGKTERECVEEAIKIAESRGYIDIEEVIDKGNLLKPGDKVYITCMNKALALFHIGHTPLSDGIRILGAHIDSPRLDLKQKPLYENEGLAYMDTHYYGGIKKYQWVTTQLSIHGIFVKKDGSIVKMVVGEDEDDPVVFISDLLLHLSGEQLQKKANMVIEGEELDVVIGSRSIFSNNEKTDTKRVKSYILELLKKKYNIEEEDFISAEIEIVPADKARDCGLDKSMIIGYGQDDRVCAYASLEAQLAISKCDVTNCTILVDKEEIGSVGATGMQSKFLENSIAEIMELLGQYSEINLRRCLRKSRMLSSDVSAAYDPMFDKYFEKKNTAYLGRGIVFNKYTGVGGKVGSNDANPEYMALIRHIMDQNEVVFQTAELGKVDCGGGGTVAYIAASYGMQVIDSGVAVLNMHAPMEVTSKADIYEAYRGYRAFLEEV